MAGDPSSPDEAAATVVPADSVRVSSPPGSEVDEVDVVDVVAVGVPGAGVVVPGAERVVGEVLLVFGEVLDDVTPFGLGATDPDGFGVEGRAAVGLGEGRAELEEGLGVGVAEAAGGAVLGRAPAPKAKPITEPGAGA